MDRTSSDELLRCAWGHHGPGVHAPQVSRRGDHDRAIAGRAPCVCGCGRHPCRRPKPTPGPANHTSRHASMMPVTPARGMPLLRQRYPPSGDLRTDGGAPMLSFVHGPIIDGERWIAERLAFLRQRLAAELTVEERSAVHAEIELLSKEGDISLGGLRAGRISRRLRRRT